MVTHPMRITLTGWLALGLLFTFLHPSTAQMAAGTVTATLNKYGDYELKVQAHAGDTIEVTTSVKPAYKVLYGQASYDTYIAHQTYGGAPPKQKSDTEFSYSIPFDGTAYVIVVPSSKQKMTVTGNVVASAKPVIFYPAIDYGQLPATTATDYIHKIVHLANMKREAEGCVPLTIDSKLAVAAQSHSKDMGLRNYSGHTAPNDTGVTDYKGEKVDVGTGFEVRVGKSGFQVVGPTGENLAYGWPTPESAFDAWMKSDGHRRNILNCDYTLIGVGAYQTAQGKSTYQNYWAQVFAQGPAPSAASQPAAALPAATQAPQATAPANATPTHTQPPAAATPTSVPAGANTANPTNLGELYTQGSITGSTKLTIQAYPDELYTIIVTPAGQANPAIAVTDSASKSIATGDKAGSGAVEQLEFGVAADGKYIASIQLKASESASYKLYYRPKPVAGAEQPAQPAAVAGVPVEELPSAFAVGQSAVVFNGHDWYQGAVINKNGDYVSVSFVNKYGHAETVTAHVGDPEQVLTLKDAQAQHITPTLPNSSKQADPEAAPAYQAQAVKAADFKEGQDIAIHSEGAWFKGKLTKLDVVKGQVKTAEVTIEDGRETMTFTIEAPTVDTLLTLKQAAQADITVITLGETVAASAATGAAPAAAATATVAPTATSQVAAGAGSAAQASDFTVGQEVALHSEGIWYKATITELQADKETLKRVVVAYPTVMDGVEYAVAETIEGSITTNDLLTLKQAADRKIALPQQ